MSDLIFDKEKLDKIIDEMLEQFEKSRTRRENPYVLDLIRELLRYGERGRRRQYVIDDIWKRRNGTGLNMPKAFESTVQAAYNSHCKESSVFSGNPDDDLFFPVGGKGSGKWGLRTENAIKWVQKKHLEITPSEE